MEVVGRQDAVTQIVADVQRPLVGEHKAQIHSAIRIKDLLHGFFTQEIIKRDDYAGLCRFRMSICLSNENTQGAKPC